MSTGYFSHSPFSPPSYGFASQLVALPKPAFNIGACVRQKRNEEKMKRQAEKEGKLSKGKEKVIVHETSPLMDNLMINSLSSMLNKIHEQTIPLVAGIREDVSDDTTSKSSEEIYNDTESTW